MSQNQNHIDPKSIIESKRMHSYKHLFINAPQVKRNPKIYNLLSPKSRVIMTPPNNKSLAYTSLNDIAQNIAKFYNNTKAQDSLLRFNFNNTHQTPSKTDNLEPSVICDQYDKFIQHAHPIALEFKEPPQIPQIIEEIKKNIGIEIAFSINVTGKQEFDLLNTWIKSTIEKCSKGKQYLIVHSIGMLEIARQVNKS